MVSLKTTEETEEHGFCLTYSRAYYAQKITTRNMRGENRAEKYCSFNPKPANYIALANCNYDDRANTNTLLNSVRIGTVA